MDVNKTVQDMLVENQHIRETIDVLTTQMKAIQFHEVEIDLFIKPDFVPDLTKMSEKKDTIVMSVMMLLKKRHEDSDLSNYKDIINNIHSRCVLIGSKLLDDSFHATFTEKKTDLKLIEYFKTYHEEVDITVDNRSSKLAAKDIWEFFLRGTKPI